jgi:SAM-dependent methyltransferase
MYDYYLGGKDNFEADRAAADLVLAISPQVAEASRLARAMIGRVVRHLVAERGVRQIIDVGSGLPTRENVHEVAHRIDPSTRVVYVDHDAMVCAHSRALLNGGDNILVLRGDLSNPDGILKDPQVGALIEFDRPVAVLMMSVLHLIPEADKPHDILASYRKALAPGSYLAISHATNDVRSEQAAGISRIYERADSPFVPRSRAEITRFFGDFALEPPGLANFWPFVEAPEGVDPELARTGLSAIGRKLV